MIFLMNKLWRALCNALECFKNIFLLGEYALDPCPGKAPFPNFEYLNIFSPSRPCWRVILLKRIEYENIQGVSKKLFDVWLNIEK